MDIQEEVTHVSLCTHTFTLHACMCVCCVYVKEIVGKRRRWEEKEREGRGEQGREEEESVFFFFFF